MTAKSIFDRRKAFGAVICGVLCLLMLVGLAFLTETDAHAATVTASGKCGSNLTWSLDSEGALTISGSGAMTSSPWRSSYSSSIKTVVIGDGVTSIGYEAFDGCSSLTSIMIPKSVTSIESSAFMRCGKLTSVTIPDGVTSIGSLAFWYCSSLTSITIPNSVMSIGEDAFYNCSKNLESITVAEGNIKYHSSWNCLIETESKTLILGCKNSIIPSDGSVTSIADDAFRACSGLKSITIPDGVTSIGSSAFYYCNSLTSIIIPDSVTSIGNYAFYYCNSLTTSIIIPDSVTSIGNYAFYNCSSLMSITIPNSVTSIGYSAFYNCSKLTSITIPDSVTSIGVEAFYGCSKLTSITIPDSVTSIGKYTFSKCSGLTSVTIGNGVTNIENYAFYYCSSLTNITIPDSVTSIGSYAFSGCWSLELVTINSVNVISSITSSDACGYLANYAKTFAIKSDITTIGSYITSNFTNVDTITLNGLSYNVYSKHTHSVGDANWTVSDNGDKVCSVCGLTVSAPAPAKTEGYCGNNVKWAFDDETSTLTITGKGAMKDYSGTSMPWYAYASQIKKVVIGEGVTTIGKNAFNNGKAGFVFTEISLPSTLTSIGNYAFYGCTGLTEIDIPASVTGIGKYALRKTGISNVTIGRCGKTADWMLDDEGTLTIFGDGAMFDYGSKSAPWASYKEQIKKVVVCEGITSIGKCAFYECANITSVSLPSSLTGIGNYAFYGCRALGGVGVPADVANIGIYAFRKCTSLVTATFENAEGWSYGDASAEISATALKSNYKNAWTRA